ncbi:MAG: hypothetical protein IIB99_06950 [Planctomycetes bacterium]|nr:hypothetical protein [Planctomycetota bacterium]
MNYGVLIEIDFTTSGTPVQQTVESAIQASPGGIGLEFYALCDGPEIPDDTYSVAAGNLIQHPADAIRYWLQEVGGIPSADVDDVTFDAAVTNLPGYEWGFDARNLGANWEAILLRMGYEARANIVKPSDVKYKMLTATSSHSFGSGVVTIDSTERMAEIHKDDAETIAQQAVKTAIEFNVHCGGEITLMDVE